MENAKTSMYDDNRSYIYNKAFFEEMINKVVETHDKIYERNKEFLAAVKAELLSKEEPVKTTTKYLLKEDRFQNIRNWAEERGLYEKGDTKTQFLKLMEEAGELGRAILKDDQVEFVDAIGDMVVVLTNLAHLGNTSIEACVDSAYDVISKRTGKMVNGTFVKDN